MSLPYRLTYLILPIFFFRPLFLLIPQTILGSLYSLRDIVVTKDVYGVPYLPDPSQGGFYKNPQTIFSVYTITFRSSCFDATGMVNGGFCAGYNGDEALFTVDPSNVQYAASPYINQERPTISVRKQRKGYAGNMRIGTTATADLSALSMTLVPVNATAREGTEQLRAIGMKVKQMLHCTASGAGAAFSLVVVNDTIQVSQLPSLTPTPIPFLTTLFFLLSSYGDG